MYCLASSVSLAMILHMICKSVNCISEMISQLNHLVFSPAVYGIPFIRQNPSWVLMKIQCFSSSRHSHDPKHSLTQSSNSFVTNQRISRVARTEAQDALFDYLHCTRSFQFTDAEHVSKNSPQFLQQMLSKIKIESEQDVTRSLSKFLRYNPINEFEPFFESLGLTPPEFAPLLPRNLMFLSDDHAMLENFHVLCDYGIPRGKIGKMYKEAKEIFGYGYGVLALKLRAYEILSLSKSTVIKLVSCCPSLLIGDVCSEFVRLLEKLNGLGIENDWIGGYLTGKSSTYNWTRMLDTMEFLDTVGYTEEQVRILFKTNPALLIEGSGKQIYVLVGWLLKLGLKMDQIFSSFTHNPQILSQKHAKNLWRAVCFLFEIGMEIEDVANIVSTHMQLLSSYALKGPRTVLRDTQLGCDGLCQIIKDDPLKLISLASKSKKNGIAPVPSETPSKLMKKSKFLLKLGYVDNSDEMMKALKQFRGRADQLQERFDCLVQAGLDCNVASSMIKQVPQLLNQTKDVIEKKIDCLRNCLGYPLESVVAFPAYLCYDMERISLRFSMYAWMRERGKAKPMLSLSTILACSDSRFVKYFVVVHPEGPAMWESLKKSLPSR